MCLVNSFDALMQPLAALMTQPSFSNFVTLITGWVFANRRTVTQMIVAAGAINAKHHSSYHRLFAAARWSRDQLGLTVLDMILSFGSLVLAPALAFGRREVFEARPTCYYPLGLAKQVTRLARRRELSAARQASCCPDSQEYNHREFHL